MSDLRLRDLERKWQSTGAVEDEGAYLLERVRAGQLENRVLIRAALFGSPAARAVQPNFHEKELGNLEPAEMDEVLRLVFGNDIPEKARGFLRNIAHHDQEARRTLTHYGLIEEEDKAPPDTATALEALFEDLRSTPEHVEAINQMQRPVLQLIPVYEHEGAGFQRMIDALNARRREGDKVTEISDLVRLEFGMSEGPEGCNDRYLQELLRMNEGTSGKIVGWQVAVVEGAGNLPPESNSHRNEVLEVQLTNWQKDCMERNIQLCDKKSYVILGMQKVIQAADGTPIWDLGIDFYGTIFGDTDPGALIVGGSWYESVDFIQYNPEDEDADARFRPKIIVKKIL